MGAGGAPPYYKEPEELREAIQAYFDKIEKSEKKLTISGLAYELGFESRQSFYDYEKRNDQFSYIIKRARLFIENVYESRLQENNPTGSIFWLKNSGWSDRQDITQEINGKIDLNANITYQGIEIVQPPDGSKEV